MTKKARARSVLGKMLDNRTETLMPSLPEIQESTISPQRRGRHGGSRAGPPAPHALPANATTPHRQTGAHAMSCKTPDSRRLKSPYHRCLSANQPPGPRILPSHLIPCQLADRANHANHLRPTHGRPAVTPPYGPPPHNPTTSTTYTTPRPPAAIILPSPPCAAEHHTKPRNTRGIVSEWEEGHLRRSLFQTGSCCD
jgi:hypothetical protein